MSDGTTHLGRVQTVFHAVLSREPGERDAYLGALCSGDEALRCEVLALLQIDARSPTMFRDDQVTKLAGGRIARVLADEHQSATVTERIGGYEVRGVLGVGGMGIVYRAGQQHPHRDVAIKVLRRGVFAPSLAARFARETEILGRLKHSGIAQIYDAGIWHDGDVHRPYFVMELVEGVSLDQFIKRKAPPIRDRLELFVRISDAVQHAHEHGVIHRDLKPANIMITAAGEPKILDFGVARLSDVDQQIATLHTDAGQLIGTLPYMSPEQVSGGASPTDARCDVYALGVILYELLTGTLPLDVRHSSIVEAALAIREDEPTRLSHIDRSLRGDLETIAMHALEKSPADRYQSAAEMSRDVRAFISDHPITARPANTLYRLRKFARRNKGLVLGVATAFLVLVAASIVSLRLAFLATARGRDAEQRSTQAEALNQFFLDMLGGANPRVNLLELDRPSDVRVVDILDYASANLASAYPDQPQVEASVRVTLADAYAALDMNAEAIREIVRAVDLRTDQLGAGDIETQRAQLKHADYLNSVGDLTQAEGIYRELAADFESRLGLSSEETISAQAGVAASLYYQGHRADALARIEGVAQRAEASFPAGHPLVLTTLGSLGRMLIDDRRPAEAEPILRRVLQGTSALRGENHPETWPARSNLVDALRRQQRLGDAIDMQNELLAAQRRLLPEDHGAVLFSMNNVAVLLAEAGRRDEAIEVLRHRIELRPDESTSLLARHNLAAMLMNAGELEEAEAMERFVLEKRRQLPVPRPDEVSGACVTLARILAHLGRHDEADPLLAEAVMLAEQAFGAAHARVVRCRFEYGKVLRVLGRFEEAAAEFERCDAHRDFAAKWLIDALPGEFIALYEAWGRPDDAERWRSIANVPAR